MSKASSVVAVSDVLDEPVVKGIIPKRPSSIANKTRRKRESHSNSNSTVAVLSDRAQEYRDRLTNAKSASEAKLEKEKDAESHAETLVMLSGTSPKSRVVQKPKKSRWCFNGICSSKKASVYSVVNHEEMNAGKTRRNKRRTNRHRKKRLHSSRR